MLDSLKNIIDYLSTPTISFTLITVLFPFIFPPTDWFDKINRKLRIYKIWSNTGGFIQFALITGFFVLGYKDPNFKIILMKGDNFPIVLMIYTMFFFTWYAMKKSYISIRKHRDNSYIAAIIVGFAGLLWLCIPTQEILLASLPEHRIGRTLHRRYLRLPTYVQST